MATLAVFAVVAVLEMIIHGTMLKEIYQQTASIWRPQAEASRRMFYMWLAWAIFAPFFVLIYTYGYERAKVGWEQGLRYGLFIGLMTAPSYSLIWYVVLPIPGKLAFYWFLDGLVVAIVAGIVVGLIYREGR